MLTVKEMLEAGVHFGHQVKRWNPKMKPYIFGTRNGMHIIDVIKTRILLQKICDFLQENVNKETQILFVGTKIQAASVIEEMAIKSSSYYVNQRWLGGMLTNWKTIKTCIQRLKEIESLEENNFLNNYSKKDIAKLRKRKEKLQRYFGGMKTMERLPDLVILVGQPKELNAIRECQKLNIKTITILDTNCDPSLTNLFIPANDDSIKSIRLILNELSTAIATNR
jgi:small subunit ribosomal protein S2